MSAVDGDAFERLVVSLQAELATLRAENERLRQEQAAHEGELGDMRSQMSAAEAETDSLRRERDEAREQGSGTYWRLRSYRYEAELARVQPVIDAAKAWRPIHGSAHDPCRPERCGQLTCVLTRAIDALDAATPPATERRRLELYDYGPHPYGLGEIISVTEESHG